jgi:hypothetical protein
VGAVKTGKNVKSKSVHADANVAVSMLASDARGRDTSLHRQASFIS